MEKMRSTTAPLQTAAWRDALAELERLRAECAALYTVAREAEALRRADAAGRDAARAGDDALARALLDWGAVELRLYAALAALPDEVRGRL